MMLFGFLLLTLRLVYDFDSYSEVSVYVTALLFVSYKRARNQFLYFLH